MKEISLETIRECLREHDFRATLEVLDLEIVSQQDPSFCGNLGLSTKYLTNMVAQREINVAEYSNLANLLDRKGEARKKSINKESVGKVKKKADENNSNTIGLYNLINLHESENEDNGDSVQLKKAEINIDEDIDYSPISQKRDSLMPPSELKFSGMHNLMAVQSNLKRVKADEPNERSESEIGEMDSFDEEEAIKKLPFIPYYANECKFNSNREIQGAGRRFQQIHLRILCRNRA